MFNKVYPLTLHKEYVSRWGMLEAVRELIQNSLDSESPFEYNFLQQDIDYWQLTLVSKFSTLPVQSLLLGTTSKAENDSAIGSFGEGYKLALLVLTRLDYPVEILNGKVQWKPSFQYNKLFEAELLSIEESSLAEKHSGLTIKIRNLSEADCEAIKDSCLFMQKHIGEVKNTKYGQILLERPAKLYVGGLFVCETELDYGYNIEPCFLSLERDRQTVNDWDLKQKVKDMWFDIGEPALVAQMMEEGIPDLEYAHWNTPEVVKEACYQLFISRNPNTLIASSERELKERVAKGMEKIVVLQSRSFSTSVCESTSYKKNLKQPQMQTISEYLAEWAAKNKSYMRRDAQIAFKSIIEEAKTWRRT